MSIVKSNLESLKLLVYDKRVDHSGLCSFKCEFFCSKITKQIFSKLIYLNKLF